MSLYEQIKNEFPELTDKEFMDGTIVLRNDSDGAVVDALSGSIDVYLNGTTDYIEAYGYTSNNNTVSVTFSAFKRLGV